MNKWKAYCLPLALIISYFLAMQVLGPIWSNNNIFQDDFRQSIFWAWSLWDQELFVNDFFRPMYDSLLLRTPLLDLIYHLAPVITDNLIWYNKFLVFLIFISSSYAVYKFFNKLSDDVVLALSATGIFSTVFWCTDHLSCGHTRSFLWFGLFYYMYLKLSDRKLAAAIYTWVFLFLSPHVFIICFMMEFILAFMKAIELFVASERGEPFTEGKWSEERGTNSYSCLNILGSYTVIGLFASFTSAIILYKVIFKDVTNQGVGTLFTLEEMKALPEFNPGGRHPIFGASLTDGSWWTNEHWGMGIGFLPISKLIIVTAIIIPLYLSLEKFVFKRSIKWGELAKTPLMVLFVSSCVLYFIAQIVFPALYLPSRFIAVPWLLVAVSVLILITNRYLHDFVTYVSSLKATTKKSSSQQYDWTISVLLVLIAFLFWNYYHKFYYTRYVGITPEVKNILDTTPKNSLIAGHPLLPDLNSASIASKRKVFVDYERSMAYTHESLAEIRRRNYAALQLTYAKTREDFLRIARENGITHYMALYDFYTPQYLANPKYLEPYNAAIIEITRLQPGQKFFIQSFLEGKQLRYAVLDISQI